MARPSVFSQDLADRICELLADGLSLRSICEADDMPSRRTVLRWLASREEFCRQYAQAREAQADAIFDDILSIADDGSNDWIEKRNKDGEVVGYAENGEAARRSALRVEARKFVLSRMAPKKYGDKLDLNHGVQDSLGDFLAALDGKTRGVPGS